MHDAARKCVKTKLGKPFSGDEAFHISTSLAWASTGAIIGIIRQPRGPFACVAQGRIRF